MWRKVIVYELFLTAAVVGLCYLAAVWSDGNVAAVAVPIAILIFWPILEGLLHYPAAKTWWKYLCTDTLPEHGLKVNLILGGIAGVTLLLAYQGFLHKNFR